MGKAALIETLLISRRLMPAFLWWTQARKCAGRRRGLSLKLRIFGLVPMGIIPLRCGGLTGRTTRQRRMNGINPFPPGTTESPFVPYGESASLYTDEVEIGAWPRTGLVFLWSRLFIAIAAKVLKLLNRSIKRPPSTVVFCGGRLFGDGALEIRLDQDLHRPPQPNPLVLGDLPGHIYVDDFISPRP